MKNRAFPFRVRIALCALGAAALWIINVEVRGLPSQRSLFYSRPASTNMFQGDEILSYTNDYLVITSSSEITEEDFSCIKDRLRSFAYQGKFFDSIEISNRDTVLALNTNKSFSVQLDRDRPERTWHADGLQRWIVD